jgi:hypothetical protein
MRPSPVLCFLATAALLLALGCAAKGVKETKASAEMAVIELQNLVDEGIEKGVKEREKGRSEEPLDFPGIARTAVLKFQGLPQAREAKNAFNPAKPVFVASTEGREPGSVYIDASRAATGAIFVTAVFKDGAALKRDARSVKVNTAARPPKIDVDTGAMPAAPGL